MVDFTPETPKPNVQCREIADSDLDGVVDCLARNFRRRSRMYWSQGLAVISGLPRMEGFPRYGWLLENDGRVVGVLLQIFTNLGEPQRAECAVQPLELVRRRKLSGFRQPSHRRAVQSKSATYTNISPAPHAQDD